MDDQPTPKGPNPTELSAAFPPAEAVRPPNFVRLKVQGVGGWLLFFVIGHLVLRPASYFGRADSDALPAEVAERFPFTASVVNIERIGLLVLVVFGILVALALLKTGHRWPVDVTKIYLLANPLFAILLVGLYVQSDLPEAARSKLIVSGVLNLVGLSVMCVVWFLYFTRSKRVQATYFEKMI